MNGLSVANGTSVNLGVNCNVDNGLCDHTCVRGSAADNTVDHCTCPNGTAINAAGFKCLGQYNDNKYKDKK